MVVVVVVVVVAAVVEVEEVVDAVDNGVDVVEIDAVFGSVVEVVVVVVVVDRVRSSVVVGRSLVEGDCVVTAASVVSVDAAVGSTGALDRSVEQAAASRQRPKIQPRRRAATAR